MDASWDIVSLFQVDLAILRKPFPREPPSTKFNGIDQNLHVM